MIDIPAVAGRATGAVQVAGLVFAFVLTEARLAGFYYSAVSKAWGLSIRTRALKVSRSGKDGHTSRAEARVRWHLFWPRLRPCPCRD